MWNVCFHLKLCLNYLKSDKKVPEKYRNEVKAELEALLKKIEKLNQEF